MKKLGFKKTSMATRAEILANIDRMINELITVHGQMRSQAADPDNTFTSTTHIDGAKRGVEMAVQNLKNQRSYIERLGNAVFPKE